MEAGGWMIRALESEPTGGENFAQLHPAVGKRYMTP